MRRANAATDPIQAKAAWEKKCKTTAKLQQYTYGCKLLTPLFAGGVQTGQVDPFMPIRVPGIRGQLRFWWRIACADPHAPSAETFCRERDLWGGIGNSEPSASQIRIRVLAKPVNPSELISADATLGGVEKYAYGPGIIDGATALRAGYGFQLELSCPDAIADDVQTALRWWASFGGIGARTRRGLGAVQVEGIEPIDEQAVARRGGLLKCRREPFDAPQDAWTCAVTMLHQFRQGRGTGRNAQSTNDPKRPGRSFGPSPTSYAVLPARTTCVIICRFIRSRMCSLGPPSACRFCSISARKPNRTPWSWCRMFWMVKTSRPSAWPVR